MCYRRVRQSLSPANRQPRKWAFEINLNLLFLRNWIGSNDHVCRPLWWLNLIPEIICGLTGEVWKIANEIKLTIWSFRLIVSLIKEFPDDDRRSSRGVLKILRWKVLDTFLQGFFIRIGQSYHHLQYLQYFLNRKLTHLSIIVIISSAKRLIVFVYLIYTARWISISRHITNKYIARTWKSAVCFITNLSSGRQIF